VVVRLNRQSLPLFDGDGNRLRLLPLFQKLPAGQAQEWTARVRYPAGGWIAGRLIATRRSAQATRLARLRLERRASRKQRQVSREAWKAAAYFAVWTSLPETFSARATLELYRLRCRRVNGPAMPNLKLTLMGQRPRKTSPFGSDPARVESGGHPTAPAPRGPEPWDPGGVRGSSGALSGGVAPGYFLVPRRGTRPRAAGATATTSHRPQRFLPSTVAETLCSL
jgi:hypothetical protein